jgi:hypothetical protein
LPKIDLLVDATSGHNRMSFLDAFEGYHQVALSLEDHEKTAFITPLGIYYYKVMPLHIPILALMDNDPHGLKILSVYDCGSKNMSYDNSNLTTPNILWLGIKPKDFEKYNIPEKCLLSITKR